MRIQRSDKNEGRRQHLALHAPAGRAVVTAGVLIVLVTSQLVRTGISGAVANTNPQVALAERLLAAAQDTTKPPAQRALDTARLALDARRSGVDARLRPLLDQEARNLDTAERLLGLGSPEGTDTLSFGIEVARAATAWQLETLGFDNFAPPRVPSHHLLPSTAIQAFVEQQGGSLTHVQERDLLRLDALPGKARTALTDFVDAFSALALATTTAYADADQERLLTLTEHLERGSLDQLDLQDVNDSVRALNLDLNFALEARAEFLSTVIPLRDALQESGSGLQMSPELQIAPFISVELLGGNTTYSQDFLLTIDLFGDDLYLNNAGGGGGRAGALVDFGGADRYVSGRSGGINGGGSAGVGVLVDASGSDTYTAGNGGTNGGGQVGLGLLLDAVGTNSFSAGSIATNGGGAAGGVGLLIDPVSGSTFSAVNTGTNGGASLGGAGFLFSSAGLDLPDSYSAGSNGTNGGGTFGGVGFLMDGGVTGDPRDSYSATSAGTNGGAGGLSVQVPLSTTGGVGFLLDASGDDGYGAGSSGANGGGHAGVGMLIDVLGNDRATAGSTGVNGGGALGVGFLIDSDGNDEYAAGAVGANGSGSAGAGLLFDASGTDLYADSEPPVSLGGIPQNGSGWDQTRIPKGAVGAQIDNPPPSPVPTTIPNVTTSTVTTTSVPLPTTTLPTTTTSTLPQVTTTSITLPSTTTTSSTTTSSTTTTSIPLPPTTVPPTPPVITVDFEDVEPCSSHAINDDSLFGIWHSPLAGGAPYSVCVVLRFPIEMRIRITVDPDAVNP